MYRAEFWVLLGKCSPLTPSREYVQQGVEDVVQIKSSRAGFLSDGFQKWSNGFKLCSGDVTGVHSSFGLRVMFSVYQKIGDRF